MNKLSSILLFLLATIAFHNSWGQEQTIEINGTIVEADTKDPVPYVHVINKTMGKGTVSNTEGRFWMKMHKTDTILFSAIGFEPYAFIIKDQVTSDKLIVTIELNTSTMELQPVKIFAYKDEYALKRAILNMDVPLEEEKPIVVSNWKGPSNTLPGGGGGVSIGGPFSALYNAFSKEAKEKRKLQQYQKEYDYQKLIQSKYNEGVVKELTGLPDDKVEEFMEYCKLDDSFIGRASEYEIAVVVNRCLTEFIELEVKED